ncbi:MAG TPA: PHB depolymerase family esterase [Candidatus Acidoferrales bacterium]|nr:PHB depolymerase family esterase [Candidatus Acidoferrales bacterium]
MKLNRYFLAVVVLLGLTPTPAVSQSLPNLPLTRLAYTVRKRVVNPQGELKTKIDAIDTHLAEATRLGRIGEIRRLLAEGMVLMAGSEWTDELDYKNSLALRSGEVIVDSTKPYEVRLEQIYAPSLALDHDLAAHFSLCRFHPPAPGQGGANAQAASCDLAKDLGKFDEVRRDLLESPFRAELDLAGVADGAYVIRGEVLDGEKSLGSSGFRVMVEEGLDQKMETLEAESRTAPQAVRADVMFPVERIRNIDLGRIDLGAFDPAREFATAEETLAAAKAGRDPFAGRTGSFERHYYLEPAKEIMPYRLYVPTSYNGTRAFPLIVALHGLGGTEDSMFGPMYGMVPLAEQHGYIVVGPLGYRIDGFYGGIPGAGPASRSAQLSEQDVIAVLGLVRKEYRIDDSRIYLMGHSMGGIGTWALGAKYPDVWAALGPISGTGNPATVEKMRSIPEIVVHGDADTVVPIAGAQAMVAAMNKLGTEVKFIVVSGGSHMSVPGPNMAAIFDFFDAHRKAGGAASGSR